MVENKCLRSHISPEMEPYSFIINTLERKIKETIFKNKGPNRVRTGDLLICSQLLYHWAMDPIWLDCTLILENYKL